MKKWLPRIAIGLLLVGTLVAAVYFYVQYSRLNSNNADKELKEIVGKVGKMMMLPDEVPTIATVTDNTKLEGQKFFKSSQNGDKVLIYPLSSKAILYRPKINKIIEVASVLPVNSVVTPSVAKVNEAPSVAKIVLLNGTKTLGLTAKWEKTILDKTKSIEIVDKQTASQTDYQKTVVVDLSGKFGSQVEELKNLFGAVVMSIPSGESKPEADIMVILGKNSI